MQVTSPVPPCGLSWHLILMLGCKPVNRFDAKMRSLLTLALILCSVYSLFAGNSEGGANSDFSGMDQFWKILDTLQKDRKPTQSSWDSLFSTPGYAVLTQSEFSREHFVHYFSLAFMPSKSAEFKEELKKTDWKIRYNKHIAKVPQNREPIQNQRKKLETTPTLIDGSLNLARAYLPKYEIDSSSLPPISFVIFGNDARGYSPIVIDLLYCVDQEDNLKYLIGHESHHFYRNQMLTFQPPDLDSTDHDIIWVLNQLQAEGIADQIDKRINFFEGGYLEHSKWAQRYKDFLRDSPEIIRKMDELLTAYSEEPSNRQKLAVQLRELIPMSGHPTGYYMASMIIEDRGKKSLIRDIGNPFKFVRLYNEAAKSAEKDISKTGLSKTSMNLIKYLENQYSK